MKKYLFGLGAMLVGAGLMFVSSNTEVIASGTPEPCVCSGPTLGKTIPGTISHREGQAPSATLGVITHCQCGKLDCVTFWRGPAESGNQLSCHRDEKGLFK